MTAPRIDVEGMEEAQKKMAALAKRYSRATVEGAIAAGHLVRSEAIKSIHDQSSGEQVVRTRTGGGEYTHTASKPGDAPNTDTGRLVQSVQVEVTGKTVDVGSTLHYAAHLEFGTRKMYARPWLFPAFDGNKAAIVKLIKHGIDDVTKKHGDL